MYDEDEDITIKVILGIVVFLAIIFGVSWAVKDNYLREAKHFDPKFEAVRRETYEQTKSYRQGSVQRLSNLCMQVSSADDAHKGMIYQVISHEAAEWDIKDVPSHLQGCLSTARQ